MDRESGARRRETPRLPVQSRYRTPWTRGAFMDDGRLTHNPEVAGSNPAPATKCAGQRPLPVMGGAFLLWFVNVFVNEVGGDPCARSLRSLLTVARGSRLMLVILAATLACKLGGDVEVLRFAPIAGVGSPAAMRTRLRQACRPLGARTTQPSDRTSNSGSVPVRGGGAPGGHRLAVDAEFGCRCGADFIGAAGCIRAGSGCASGVVEPELPGRLHSRALRRAAACAQTGSDPAAGSQSRLGRDAPAGRRGGLACLCG